MTEAADMPVLSARDRVLRVAAAAFAERGFSNTTLAEIAARLGIKKSSLYYHFDGKDAILIALIFPLLDRIDDMLDEVDSGKPQEPAEYLAHYSRVLQSDPTAVAILGADQEAWARPQVYERIATHQRRLMSLFLADDEDPTRAFRVHMALDTLQRGLVAGRASTLPVDSTVLPPDERAVLATRIAEGILPAPVGGPSHRKA